MVDLAKNTKPINVKAIPVRPINVRPINVKPINVKAIPVKPIKAKKVTLPNLKNLKNAAVIEEEGSFIVKSENFLKIAKMWDGSFTNSKGVNQSFSDLEKKSILKNGACLTKNKISVFNFNKGFTAFKAPSVGDMSITGKALSKL